MTGIRSSKRTLIRKCCQPGFRDDPVSRAFFTGRPHIQQLPPVNYFAWEQQMIVGGDLARRLVTHRRMTVELRRCLDLTKPDKVAKIVIGRGAKPTTSEGH
jgi:hypothetical protein